MAIYHCNVKTHSRTQESANHAVRSAAYRAGAILVDEVSGNKYNYSRKSEVTFSEIVVPANAPEWAKERNTLWNNVEKSEKRVDAVLFREIEVALPKELTQSEWVEIIREYVLKTMTTYGIIVDYSIHDKDGNPHCHMMLTLRDISELGFGNKNRDWNDKKLLYKWRQEWEKITNAYLAKAGISETIDCRSLKAQGVDRLPTVHEGREGIGGQNKHIVTERRHRNHRVRSNNKDRSELKEAEAKSSEVHARIKEIDSEIYELSKPEITKSNDPIPVVTGVQSDNTPAIPSPPIAKNPILVSIHKKILQSVKPVQPSKSTAMMVYQAPRPKIGTIPGIDRSFSFNLPSNPKEAARCYSLRALFGSNIDIEFNSRLKAMQNIGKNYSWQAFYLDIQDTVDSKHGTNLTWWRSYTKMVYHKHLNKLTDIYELAPKKYVNKLDEYVSTLLPGYTEKKEVSSSNLTTGQSANPDITSSVPIEPKRDIDIPWTDLPEEPESHGPDYFNPCRKEPEYNFNPYAKEPESNFNPSNNPWARPKVPSAPKPAKPTGDGGSSTPKPW